MKRDFEQWFKKGGSEKLIKKLKGLIKKLTNIEERAAAGRKTGFVALPGDEEDTLAEARETSTTIKRSGGRSKNLSQMVSKYLPPEVKTFMKPGGYSKKLWGMALKYIPPEAKKFLKLGGGKGSAYKAAARKTGFTPLGRGQAKTKRGQAGPPSFMKGQYAQESQEETAARYLKDEEISQRGLAPDATEKEKEAQQALEQRQRASSAGEGFFSKPTFMKRKRPSLPPAREVEEGETSKTIRSEIKTLEKAELKAAAGKKTGFAGMGETASSVSDKGLSLLHKYAPEFAKGLEEAKPGKFDGLKLPKETEDYTELKDKFEEESSANNKPDDKTEEDISELQAEVEKTTATMTELEEKLAELERKTKKEENFAESQSHNIPKGQEATTINNFMNQANRVVWNPL